MTNLVKKFNGEICWNNQVHKFGVQFGEIIGLTNIVEKWVDNLAEKIRWNNLVEKLSWTSLQCTLYSVQ